jgi:hypothetical protein
MASLKLIADEIADALSRPFDDMFKERIKAVFRHQLATYIRQQINKYGIENAFKTRFSAECVAINPSDSPYEEMGVDYLWYRTINQIPQPVRYTSDEPFTYVGFTNGLTPFIHTNLVEVHYADMLSSFIPVTDANEGTVEPYRYFYRNGYVYHRRTAVPPVISGEQPDPPVEKPSYYILIEGIFTGYPDYTNTTKDRFDLNHQYTDDIEFPMSEDLIQLVKESLLKGEFAIIDDKDKVKPEHVDNN